jgi:PKD repeat protein
MKIKLLILSLAICGLTNAQNITANFSWTYTCANSPSCFTDMSTTNIGTIVSWAWDFGDGYNSTIQNPCHTYQNEGVYNACLTVQNTNGDTDIVCATLEIWPSPVAIFTSSNNGEVVTFSNLSEGAVLYYWNFPGGNPSTSIEVNPSTTYPIGTYSACLIAYNDFLCPDTTCQTITLTSINDTREKDIINIYPNPFSTQTTLQTDKDFKKATLKVYDSFGQRVKQFENISGQSIILSRDNLPSGLYFLQLIQDNKTFTTSKLIIIDN